MGMTFEKKTAARSFRDDFDNLYVNHEVVNLDTS